MIERWRCGTRWVVDRASCVLSTRPRGGKLTRSSQNQKQSMRRRHNLKRGGWRSKRGPTKGDNGARFAVGGRKSVCPSRLRLHRLRGAGSDSSTHRSRNLRLDSEKTAPNRRICSGAGHLLQLGGTLAAFGWSIPERVCPVKRLNPWF